MKKNGCEIKFLCYSEDCSFRSKTMYSCKYQETIEMEGEYDICVCDNEDAKKHVIVAAQREAMKMKIEWTKEPPPKNEKIYHYKSGNNGRKKGVCSRSGTDVMVLFQDGTTYLFDNIYFSQQNDKRSVEPIEVPE